MRLYSYVVARDFGFAPNPFFGVCTLCTCKPQIRARAAVGDWIIGTGSKSRGRQGCLVFAMEVCETLSYDEYWVDARFRVKRPNLRGSLKQAFGDNIYHRDPQTGDWRMLNSHHSLHDGSPNPTNVGRDTRYPRVLVATNFTYWGGSGPAVPGRFRNYEGKDVVQQTQGHRCGFSPTLVDTFVAWLSTFERGYLGEPLEWTEGRALRRRSAGKLP
ncbi:MAG TPA: hypothetical protein VF712_13940 [Thermoleophilaceae bacterium]